MLDFSTLAPIEEPVKGPDGKRYVLIRASVDAALKYRNASSAAGRFADGKLVGFDRIADSDLVLVSNCLCETTEEGEVKYKKDDLPLLVPENRIRQWPSEVLSTLFDKVLEISPRLRTEDTKEALQKQKEKIDEKLARLEASDPKALPDSGTGNSD